MSNVFPRHARARSEMANGVTSGSSEESNSEADTIPKKARFLALKWQFETQHRLRRQPATALAQNYEEKERSDCGPVIHEGEGHSPPNIRLCSQPHHFSITSWPMYNCLPLSMNMAQMINHCVACLGHPRRPPPLSLKIRYHQGGHNTGKTGNVNFSRQRKKWDLPKNIKNMILHREFTSNSGKTLKCQKLKLRVLNQVCGGM